MSKKRKFSAKTRGKASRRGAVQMEYLILAVLIAAASVVAVVVFGRSVVTSLITASQSATGEHSTAQEEFDMRKGDREKDSGKADQYHEEMHH